jgi:hypothetical protein
MPALRIPAGGKRLRSRPHRFQGPGPPPPRTIVRRLRLSDMDRIDWVYLAIIASALLLPLGAAGLVMFNDLDLMHLARTFSGAETK